MNKRTQRRRRHLRNLGIVACLAIAGAAWGESVVQFMTAKSLPDATVDVIDPETGTSTGTSGSDVNIAVGDIILFRFTVASAPASGSSAMRGIQSYVTEYIPPGTQLVGVRLIDAAGNTIEPRPAGLAIDGCKAGSCNNAPGSLQDGSVAQVYADTGAFFSETTATAGYANANSESAFPANAFLTLANGINIPGTSSTHPITQVLNDDVAPWSSHNTWDDIQLDVFGPLGGNTYHRYGSPVAGPNTHYDFEVNAGGTFTGVVGPWQRVKYPGSQIGTGVGDIGTGGSVRRVGVETTTGVDVTPANPKTATAVRFAVGEAEVGETRYVEVALKVTAVPIDNSFGAGAGNYDCGETFGSDATSTSNTGHTNPWPFFVPHPQCVFLRLKFDLTVDKSVAGAGEDENYTIFVKNLATTTEQNARVLFKFKASDHEAVAPITVPAADGPVVPCPAPDATLDCLTFTLGDLAPSDEADITVQLGAGPEGKRTNVVRATYLSNQLSGCASPTCVPAIPAIDANGFSATAMTVVADTQLPVLALSNALDVTANFAASPSAGVTPFFGSWEITGTVRNAGNVNWGSDSFTLVLPTSGYSLRSATGVANQITVGGNPSSNCTQSGVEWTCDRGDTYTAGQSRVISFRLVVPAGQAGLKTIGIRTFGDTFETNVPKAVVVPVGAVRSHKPVLDCPIVSTQPTITGGFALGETEPGANVELYFNLMKRTDVPAIADGAGEWTSFATTNALSDFAAFGGLYGGLEIRATAQLTGELESELSESCGADGVVSTRECSDGFDNGDPEDTLIDFPADPGCDSPNDNTEVDPGPPQCSDGISNPGSVPAIDWPADPSCSSPSDPTEDGVVGPAVLYRRCQDGLDNDLPADGLIDYPADPDCHSLFDDDENIGGASSPQTKARLLLIVDSSGSMNWNTCETNSVLEPAEFTGGDGSTECAGGDVPCGAGAPGAPGTCGAFGTSSCGNAFTDDSRLYQVGDGLSNVVAGFGEVEYALMRFHQRTMPFACPTTAASRQGGGWQGGGAAPCGGPPGTSFNAGDVVVSYAQDNEVTILDWMNHDDDYVGAAPIGTDFEIRGSGTTPLDGALTSAKLYLDAVRAADLKVACRPYRVILVTDGAETCGGNPSTSAAALKDSLPLIGTPPVGIPVSVIGFATPTLEPALDAIAIAGGTGDSIQVSDQAGLSAAIAQIIEDAILVETCNGLDDDCDNIADEDFPDLGDLCDNGQVGACARTGTIDCNGCDAPFVTPGTEACNGIDDDCDTKIDEGVPGCTCVATSEICNGVDDNCNGQTDETPGGTIATIVRSSNVVTVTTTTAHGLTAGDLVTIAGVANATFDGTFTITTANQATRTFTYTQTVADASSSGGTATGSLPGVGDTCGLDLPPPSTCVPGQLACVTGDLVCQGEVGPVTETCNSLDDDCDTFVDEIVSTCFGPTGFVPPGCTCAGAGCATGGGVWTCDGLCQTGTSTCATAPGACDGDVVPVTDVCDGLDNDCDGATDEGFNLGGACNNGQTGACLATGTFVCNAAGGASCTAPVVPPGIEVCNMFDDDCDGATDELCPSGTGTCVGPPIGDACGTCGGSFVCAPTGPADPTPIECGGFGPCVDDGDCIGGSTCNLTNGQCELSCCTAEVCDGADNDCDGTADDEVPGFGGDCVPPGFEAYMSCTDGGGAACTMGDVGCTCVSIGACMFGHLECEGGLSVCRDYMGPTPEVPCNGIDEDCDGEDDVTCPGAQACTPLGCANPCGPGEFPCPFGFDCQDFPSLGDFCVPDPCVNVDCDPGFGCDADTGDCVDLCLDVPCPTGSTCLNGVCQDCFNFGCPDGELCVLEGDFGVCAPDLCATVTCDPGEFCRDGDCVPLTCTPECAEGESCDEGVCIEDPCAGVGCPDDQVCDPDTGRCVADQCVDVGCDLGEACNPHTGDCIDDPCALIDCPDGFECEIDPDDSATCRQPVEPPTETIFAGGGGCCSTGPASDPRGALLLIALVALLARRRPRR